jgi:hypothetical protein
MSGRANHTARSAASPIYRPYRYSELGLTPEGHRILAIRTGNPDPAGPDVETLSRQGNVITADEIAGWFTKLGIIPTKRDLSELVYTLNVMRVTKPREQAVPESPELGRVARALASLAADVPVLLHILDDALTAAGPDAVAEDISRRLKLSAGLAVLLATVQKIQADPFMAPAAAKRRTAIWHRDLQWIGHLLAGIAKKHSKTVSWTKASGPGVDLLQTALARAGVHADHQAIAQEMKRAEKDRLPLIYLRAN